jgi:hypothetical protein
LKLASSKADYEKVGDEIYRLREEKQKVQLESAGRDDLNHIGNNCKEKYHIPYR